MTASASPGHPHYETATEYQRIAHEHYAAGRTQHMVIWSFLAGSLVFYGPSDDLTEAVEHARADRLVEAAETIRKIALEGDIQ